MAKKETSEFMAIPAKLIDSTYKSLEDGNFSALKDVSHYIDDFIALPAGIEGINKIKEENATMTIEERKELRQDIYNQMPNIPELDRIDISDGLHGVLALVRIAFRKGHEAGVQQEKLNKETSRLS